VPETYEFCHGNADLVLLTYSGRDVQSTFDFGKRLLRDSGLRDVKLLPLNSSALQLVQEAGARSKTTDSVTGRTSVRYRDDG